MPLRKKSTRSKRRMATSKNSRPVMIHKEITEKLAVKYEERIKASHKYNYSQFINDLLNEIIEKEEFVRRTMPLLSKIGINDDVLYINDERKKTVTAEVYLRDCRLYCSLDENENCDHVKFALTLPEVARLEIKKR